MANYVKIRGEKGYCGFLIQTKNKKEDKNWRKKIRNVE
jgi:hypothetical protein